MAKKKRKTVTTEQMLTAVEAMGSVRQAAMSLDMPESTLRMRLKRDAAKKNPEIKTIPIPKFAFTPGHGAFGESHIGEDGVDTLDLSKPGVISRFILTSAQNNARVHAGFWENLNAFAKYLGAEVLVSFSVYDKTGYRGIVPKGETKIARQDIWWDRAFEGHVVNKRVKLARRLSFCGELDILATAADPLSGLDAYCGRSSVIVPHNKFRFKCVESRKHQMPKEIYTTGSATEKRFIQRKTGQVAQFHHVIGALLVEVDADGYFWVHHLNAEDDGSFQCLDMRVVEGSVTEEHRITGMVLGDIHHEKLDYTTANITLTRIIPELKPGVVVVHDLIDFKSRNHHNIKDPFFRVQNRGCLIRNELYGAEGFLTSLNDSLPAGGRIVVAESNHDEALGRWLRETDWRTDPDNAEFYLSTALLCVETAKHEPGFNLLEKLLKLPEVQFLNVDDSFEIAGIECGMHGHVGPSGARGSPKGFSRLGFKSFTAHTHTPSIVDGCYTVGVMGKLDMGYNRGPSKWMHTHGIIYKNGKRAFITIKNGKWRA